MGGRGGSEVGWDGGREGRRKGDGRQGQREIGWEGGEVGWVG